VLDIDALALCVQDIHPHRMRGVCRYRARLRTGHIRIEQGGKRCPDVGWVEEAYAGGSPTAQELEARTTRLTATIKAPPAGQSGGEQEAPPSAEGSSAPSADESMEELTKLKGLLDAGVLTQDEFDAQKQKILQNM
jgi:hypothetical protein